MFIDNPKYNGFENGQVIKIFYEMTAKELLLYYRKNCFLDYPDFRLWLEIESNYIRKNDK